MSYRQIFLLSVLIAGERNNHIMHQFRKTDVSSKEIPYLTQVMEITVKKSIKQKGKQSVFCIEYRASVAQLIKRWLTDLAVPGSSLA